MKEIAMRWLMMFGLLLATLGLSGCEKMGRKGDSPNDASKAEIEEKLKEHLHLETLTLTKSGTTATPERGSMAPG
jgi:hypothetical protein